MDSLRVAALRLALNDTTRVEAEGLSFEGRADYEASARQMKAEARAGLVRVRLVAGGGETAASGVEARIEAATTDRGGYRGQMEGRIASLFRGRAEVGLSASVEDTTRDGGPDWTKARCKGRVAWSGLDLGQVPDTGLRGQADLSADIQAHGAEDLSVGLDVKAPALRYGSGDSARSLPPIHLLADLTGGAAPSRRGFYIKRLTSEINEKTVDVEVAGSVSDGGLKIDLRRAKVDVSRAAALMEGLIGPLGGSVSGTVGLSGSVAAPPGWNDLTGDLRLRLEGIRADFPGLRLTAEGVGGEGSAALRADSLSVGVAVRAGRIAKSDLEALMDGLRGAGLSADVRCATPDSGGVLRALTTRGRVDVAARAEATLPEVGGRFKAVGSIGDIFRRTLVDIRLEASLAPSDSLSVGGVEVAGSVGVEARAAYDGGAGRADVDGRLSFGHLRLRSSSGLALDDLHGVVPFSQGIDLAGRQLIRETGDEPGGRSAPAAVPYSYVRAYYDRSKVRRPGLSLRRVEVRDAKTGALYRAGDVDAHLVVRDGGLTAPYFSLRAYEGDVAGSLRLDFGSVDPTRPDLSGLRYEVEVQVARLNASLLTDRAGVSRGDATVSADVHLKGNGLPDYRDSFGPFDVSGACHVTRIGPAAADHLLRQMDLDETDVDVQYYRRLIRQGWNFRSLAVELRHGFVYVSGQLIKPRWMPFNIPASQISRVPIRYLLTPEVREEAGP